ncbi:MFS transporter [Cupriavidus pampae]|uniref:Tartrate transporter n=1 Tax=Cupriavidus pampae TaxID=659251 RepID=A0ABN7YKS1_9BURK|nr:MFS transporter [Cupriavidus pampae]CAG9172770.1 Putative tartrate transporter [Cupriavidus pampae]
MHDEQLAASALGKINRRFIPLLFVCFVAAWLDRVNVGFAALTMNHDVGLSSTAYGIGAGIFFLTYFALELPSNLLLERFGARRWIARIMLTWGILSAAMVLVQGEKSFYLVRCLLGAAEAGFFPGIVYFLSLWVPAASRGRITASFLLAMPVASVIGGPLSGLLMQLDGLGGLHGWQWMFLVEALPSIALAPVVLLVLRDNPAQAEWLTAAERNWLTRTLAEDAVKAPAHHKGALKLLLNPLVVILGVSYFGVVGLNYGMGFFLPSIVKEFGLTLTQTGFVAAIPFAVAAIGMLWWGRRSDRLKERRVHLLLPLALTVIGLVGSTLVHPPALRLVLLCVAAFGIFSALPIFWTLPSSVLPASSVAAGIAIINSLGNLSGFINSYAVGAIKDATGSFAGGMQLIAGFGAVSIVILFLVTRNIAWARGTGATPVVAPDSLSKHA